MAEPTTPASGKGAARIRSFMASLRMAWCSSGTSRTSWTTTMVPWRVPIIPIVVRESCARVREEAREKAELQAAA
ncbi:hypothetical protein ACWGH2_37215 [Streptomyces sp. NPDC054871]